MRNVVPCFICDVTCGTTSVRAAAKSAVISAAVITFACVLVRREFEFELGSIEYLNVLGSFVLIQDEISHAQLVSRDSFFWQK